MSFNYVSFFQIFLCLSVFTCGFFYVPSSIRSTTIPQFVGQFADGGPEFANCTRNTYCPRKGWRRELNCYVPSWSLMEWLNVPSKNITERHNFFWLLQTVMMWMKKEDEAVAMDGGWWCPHELNWAPSQCMFAAGNSFANFSVLFIIFFIFAEIMRHTTTRLMNLCNSDARSLVFDNYSILYICASWLDAGCL